MILSRADLEQRLSAMDIAQMGDLTAAGTETPGAVNAALSDAHAEVMGYVGAVPIPAPEMLKRLVCDVARYNLYQRHLAEDHPVMLAYLQAVKQLRDIADGRIRLVPGSPLPGGSIAHAPPRAFTDTALSRMLP